MSSTQTTIAINIQAIHHHAHTVSDQLRAVDPRSLDDTRLSQLHYRYQEQITALTAAHWAIEYDEQRRLAQEDDNSELDPTGDVNGLRLKQLTMRVLHNDLVSRKDWIEEIQDERRRAQHAAWGLDSAAEVRP